MVKLVTALVDPHRLDAVRAALLRAGVRGMTVQAVATGRGRRTLFRGAHAGDLPAPGLRVEVLVDLFDAEAVAASVAEAAGGSADGLVWIREVEHVVRIRTGEIGPDAL